MSRGIQRIAVSGYKSIEEVDLVLGPITVLVGPNGAGKSNFVEAVELLGRIADGDLRMEVGLRGGAEAILHDGVKGPARIRLRAEASEGGLVNAYEAVLVPAAQGEMIFEREVVELHDTARYEHPWNRIIGGGTVSRCSRRWPRRGRAERAALPGTRCRYCGGAACTTSRTRPPMLR